MEGQEAFWISCSVPGFLLGCADGSEMNKTGFAPRTSLFMW